VSSTTLHLAFGVRGPNVDPAALTRLMGIEPSSSYAVGESRHPRSRGTGSWRWYSTTASDTDELFDEMLRLFRPHVDVLRSYVECGASASLVVVGDVGGIVVSSAEEAEARRIDWGEGEFEPFFDGDRVGIYVAPEVIAFLAAVGASFDTHIDFELQRDRPNWWEPESDT
jgi:hypothetical protein